MPPGGEAWAWGGLSGYRPPSQMPPTHGIPSLPAPSQGLSQTQFPHFAGIQSLPSSRVCSAGLTGSLACPRPKTADLPDTIQNHLDSERTDLLSPTPFGFLTNSPAPAVGTCPRLPGSPGTPFPPCLSNFSLAPDSGQRMNGAVFEVRPRRPEAEARPSALSRPRRRSPASPLRPPSPVSPVAAAGQARWGGPCPASCGLSLPHQGSGSDGQRRQWQRHSPRMSRVRSGARASGRGVEG